MFFFIFFLPCCLQKITLNYYYNMYFALIIHRNIIILVGKLPKKWAEIKVKQDLVKLRMYLTRQIFFIIFIFLSVRKVRNFVEWRKKDGKFSFITVENCRNFSLISYVWVCMTDEHYETLDKIIKDTFYFLQRLSIYFPVLNMVHHENHCRKSFWCKKWLWKIFFKQ